MNTNFEDLQEKKMEFAAEGKLEGEKSEKWDEIEESIQETKEMEDEGDKACEKRRKSKVGKWV